MLIGYKTEYKEGKVKITDSYEQSLVSTQANEILDFLNEPYQMEDKQILYKVAWDLDAFVAPILKLMGKEACVRLASKKHITDYKDYTVIYMPGKVFYIKNKQGITTHVYDIAQYFSDDEEPKNIIDLAAYGECLLDNIKRMGITPVRLTSPVAIYEDAILKHAQIPTIFNANKKYLEAFEYANKCAGKLWIEAYQVGQWDKCYDYDLTGAFPYQATQLYSTNLCRYVKAQKIPSNAHWGYMRGTVKITEKIHPIVHVDKQGNSSLPVGEWEDYLTLDEVKFIEKWKIGEFKIKDGWFLTFTAPTQPLNILLTKLYKWRKVNAVIDKLAKRMAAGSYGKFLETHDDGQHGEFFNPIYAAQITAKTRLAVCDFIYKNKLQDNLIAVSVDGVLSDKEIELDNSIGLGQWRLSDTSPAIVVSPGLVFQADRKPKGINYDLLMQMIKSKPSASRYEVKLKRRQTLAESMNGEFDKLGEIKEYDSAVDLYLIEHEQFEKWPKSGRELLKYKYKSKTAIAEARSR